MMLRSLKFIQRGELITFSKDLKLIFLSGNINDLNDNVIIIGYKINELIKSNVNYIGIKFS